MVFVTKALFQAPYCLYVEVLEVDDVRTSFVPHRISDIEAAEFQRKERQGSANSLNSPSLTDDSQVSAFAEKFAGTDLLRIRVKNWVALCEVSHVM